MLQLLSSVSVSLSQNRDYFSKLQSLKVIDDDYVDRHFGTEEAQHIRERAFLLLKGGNIDKSSIKVRNVKSDLRAPGEHLVAVQFKCLSSERGILHNVYVVFENKPDGEFVSAPCSCCSCEDGAFFCSHMLCFLWKMRLVQKVKMSQDEFEDCLPENPQVVQAVPMLIENVFAMDKLKRQKGQSTRKKKKHKS